MRRSFIEIGGALFALAVAIFTADPAAALDLERALRESQAVVGREVGDAGFTTSDNRQVRWSDYRGKPVLVSFVYTACREACPTTTQFLAVAVEQAQRALGPDAFDVLTVGFNLPFDNPTAMKTFALQQHVRSPRWHFLTPDVDAVERFTRDLGFVYEESPGGFNHLSQVTLVAADGRVFRQIYGESFEAAMLIAPLRELVTGTPAPAFDLADVIERVRILCSVYDPASGRYRLNYALFIEIFAGLSVLGGVAYYLGSEWRRQRPPA